MHLRRARRILLLLAIGASIVAVGCTTQTPPTVTGSNPPAEAEVPLAAKTVWSGSYARDIQPIFDQYCVNCHGPAKAENGLKLDTYTNVLRGTQHGPVVQRGSSGTSTLAAVIQGTADPKIRMPHDARRMTKNRIQNILLWIDAGAPES